MVEVVLWFMGIGLATVIAQLFAGLQELTLQRRASMHVTELAYEREALWGALYAWLFYVFYLATLAGYILFYWELRTEVYWKQWAGVVCVLVIILAATLHPQKNMPSKKYYWNLQGWLTVVWMVFMSLRASMNMILPGEAPFPLP